MSHVQRRLAGLCPLNAAEMVFEGFGGTKRGKNLHCGGQPFGGPFALQPLAAEFPNLVNKEMFGREGDLSQYMNRSSALAAIDYVVSLKSNNVFVPSRGGNIGRAMQGHRAFVGHLKFVNPNKQSMIPFSEDSSISDEEYGSIIRKLHRKTQGRPEPRNNKIDRDVTAYPIREWMFKHSTGVSSATQLVF